MGNQTREGVVHNLHIKDDQCKHRNTPKSTEIHHKASIYLPKYTHTSIVMVQVAVMFGNALFLINIGGTRAKYLSRLLSSLVSLGASMQVVH